MVFPSAPPRFLDLLPILVVLDVVLALSRVPFDVGPEPEGQVPPEIMGSRTPATLHTGDPNSLPDPPPHHVGAPVPKDRPDLTVRDGHSGVVVDRWPHILDPLVRLLEELAAVQPGGHPRVVELRRVEDPPQAGSKA